MSPTTPSIPPKPENIWLNLLCNVILPGFFLSQLLIGISFDAPRLVARPTLWRKQDSLTRGSEKTTAYDITKFLKY